MMVRRCWGRRSPACVVIKRKRGYGGAGEMGHASEPTELSAQDIRVAFRGILAQRLTHFCLT
jgi:hypothetical protein